MGLRRISALLLGVPLLMLAQMTPDAPIENFRLPLFDAEGYRLMELRGLRGHYVDTERARVEGVELVVYSEAEGRPEESRIRSPEAMIRFAEARADGASSIYVDGGNYTVQGRDWTWEGRERRLTVRANARVEILGKLEILN